MGECHVMTGRNGRDAAANHGMLKIDSYCQELGRGKGRLSLTGFRGSMALPTPYLELPASRIVRE